MVTGRRRRPTGGRLGEVWHPDMVETKSLGQPFRRRRSRLTGPSLLQVPHRADADPGLVGEFPLGQSQSPAPGSDRSAKADVFVGLHFGRTSKAAVSGIVPRG